MRRPVSRADARALAGARASAREVANALAKALHLAGDLADDLANAKFSAGTLARVNDLTRALADAHCHIPTILVDELAPAEFRACDLAHAKDLACALARATSGPVPDRALARDIAHDLACHLVEHDFVTHWARAAVTGSGWSAPGRVSRGAVALAVRLLPAAQQPRYRAEFSAELAELPGRERLGYALRVLASAWELRQALADVVRGPDGALAQRKYR